MKTKKEMQYKRLFEVIGNRLGKIISLDKLFKEVNFLLPNDLVIKSTNALSMLIRSQLEFKVFRCRSDGKVYYIFKKGIPEEE